MAGEKAAKQLERCGVESVVGARSRRVFVEDWGLGKHTINFAWTQWSGERRMLNPKPVWNNSLMVFSTPLGLLMTIARPHALSTKKIELKKKEPFRQDSILIFRTESEEGETTHESRLSRSRTCHQKRDRYYRATMMGKAIHGS